MANTTADKLALAAANKVAIKAAIAAKNPTTAPTNVMSQWPTAIASIPTGGNPAPLTVTANGTYTNDDGFSPVTVNVTDDEWPHDYSLITIDLRDPTAPLEFEMMGVPGATLECEGLTVTGSAWNSKYVRFDAHSTYTIKVSGNRYLSQNDGVIFYDYTGGQRGKICDIYITELCLGSGEVPHYACGFGYCINARLLISKSYVFNSLSENGIVLKGKDIRFSGSNLSPAHNFKYGTGFRGRNITFTGNSTELKLGDYYDREFSALESVEIPSSVTRLYGFPMQAPCVLDLDIHASVTEIGEGTFWGMSSLKRIRFRSPTPATVVSRSGTKLHFSSSFVGGEYLIIVPQGSRDAYAVSELCSRWAHHIVEGADDGTWPNKYAGDNALLQSVASTIPAASAATTVIWPKTVKDALGASAVAQLEADMAAKNYTVAWDSAY